jgi:hypothetical protein
MDQDIMTEDDILSKTTYLREGGYEAADPGDGF